MTQYSTTISSTYPLGKYSKSYPNKSDLQGTLQARSENHVSEWQHFTNPTIHLVLDIKQGGKELESVRLRIVWSMNSDESSANGTNQGEVVFEDLDLLALSCNSQRRSLQQQQLQELPLKAVYRDTVVGIRYLYGRDMPTLVYRRFQMTFMSTSAVLEFIDAIRSVCPCRANPSTTTKRDMTINTKTVLSNMSTGICAPITAHPMMDMPFSQLPYRHAPPAGVTQTQSNLHPVLPTSISVVNPQVPSPSPHISTSSLLQTEARLGASPLNLEMNNSQWLSKPAAQSCIPTAASQFGYKIQTTKMHHKTFDHVNDGRDLQKQSSMFSASNNEFLPRISDPDPGVILSSLRESSVLYDLPQSTLEKLVGDIVHEDGFSRLMESVASMWKIKQYVGV